MSEKTATWLRDDSHNCAHVANLYELTEPLKIAGQESCFVVVHHVLPLAGDYARIWLVDNHGENLRGNPVQDIDPLNGKQETDAEILGRISYRLRSADG